MIINFIKKNIFKTILFGLIPFNTLVADNFLWQIKSTTANVYILGSIHVAKKELYPLNETIYNAYNQSNFLVVEANINNADPSEIQKSAFLPKGIYLDSLIKKVNYDKLKDHFKKFNVPSFAFKNMKPWMAVMYLTQLELQKAGFDMQLGIDKHFLDKTSKEKILELESVEEQMNLLQKLDQYDADSFIEYSMNDIENTKSQIDSLFLAWKNGDTEMLNKIAQIENNDKKFDYILENLLYKRNEKMAKKIEEYLSTDYTYFVIVGAGHLVGERGIINLVNNLNKFKIEKK